MFKKLSGLTLIFVLLFLSGGHTLAQGPGYHSNEAAPQTQYLNNGSVATLPAGQLGGWFGEYFNNDVLSGSPAFVRNDSAINFNWGQNVPAPGIEPDTFSVRWTQSPAFTAGNYRFTVTADDGVRVWVNGRLMIDEWREQSVRTFTADISLPSGVVPIRVEYCELYGLAEVRLSVARQDAVGVVIDNTSNGFVKGGSPTGWTTQNEGHGGSLIWTRNNDRVRPNYNWARWYPSLAAGRYEAFVYIPDRFTTTAQARYWVSHSDGYTLRIIDQSRYSNQWVSLGTYRFRGTSADYVSLADVTYEPRLTRLIGFDAVKWEPR